MLEKLKSRKFLVTVATAAIVAAADELGLERELVLDLCGLVAVYLLGQSAVDHAAARAVPAPTVTPLVYEVAELETPER